MNYEAVNQYVLMAVGLFAALLYVGLIYAGFTEFVARISKRGESKRRYRNRSTTRRLRNAKRSN